MDGPTPRYESRRRLVWAALVAQTGWSLAGCSGRQSALDPAGIGATRIAGLFWGMTVGSAIILLAVVGLALYASYAKPEQHTRRAAMLLIVAGGVVVPTIVLTGLLMYGLSILPDFLARPPEGTLKILVTGEQWWWRVRYFPAKGEPVDLANEIRLPVGEPVEFELESPDVIHSFWIPPLGGKMDMIPGRRTRLTLQPTKTGVYRGACAEYCGTSHALMAFAVVVSEKQEFARWLEQQAKPAMRPAEPLASQGEASFVENGCGACHTVRGTHANGVVGPDLTHVGSRLTVGAGTLSHGRAQLRRWLAHTDDLKPGVHMPEFAMLKPESLTELAFYLESLK